MNSIQSIIIRHMQTHADFAACVQLQKETWGQEFSEIVPPTVLMVSQKIGGLAAGAYDEAGNMVGFVFGQAGFIKDNLMNWSQMLAVAAEWRGTGLGNKIKLFQRDFCLRNNIDYVYWTYDPLVARNAYLNLNKLGACIESYVEDFYPDGNGSVLHRGMPLDRFIVKWDLKSERVQQALSGRLSKLDVKGSPVVNTECDDSGNVQPVNLELHASESVCIEIPKNMEQIQSESLELAAIWRLNTRRSFLNYLNLGYVVDGLYARGERRFYLLRKNGNKHN